jgi:O-antigen/teichoic acid export membrane protein
MKLVRTGAKILFSRVGQVLANAAIIFLVAKTLGPVGQGHYSLTVAMALLLSALLGGGMGLAAVPPLRQGKVLPHRMLKAQLTWVGVMALVLLGLGFLSLDSHISQIMSRHLGWQRGMGFVVAGAALVLLVFDIFSYDLLARGRLVVGASVNGGRATGHLVVVATVMILGLLTLNTAVGAFALAHFAGASIILIILVRELRHSPKKLPDLPVKMNNQSLDVIPDLSERSIPDLILFNIRKGWLGQISGVAYFLVLRLDLGILEHFQGAAEVGIYSIAVSVGEMLWLLPGALQPLLVHSSSADASDPHRDKTALRAVRLGILVTLAVGVPMFFLAKPVLSIVLGGVYSESGTALQILLPGLIAFAPGAVLAGDFIGRGKPHWNTQASMLVLVINVSCCLLFIPDYGLVGAAWSSTIAYTCGSVVMLFRFRQVTGLSLWRG